MTNNNESQELLRLFKCVVDTGTEVLSAFADGKCLSQYGGSFERFLHVKKHEIFHLWQQRKVLCCACAPAGCGLKRTGHMDIWIFKKLYDESGPEEKGHTVRSSGRLEQLCLHKYIPQHIAINELDISAISFLLRNLTTLSPTEKTALDKVTTYRRDICHACSTKCYTISEINTAWNELENAFVDLADRPYKRLIKMQMKDSRKINLEEDVIIELNARLQAAELVLQNMSSPCNNNIGYILAMEDRLKDVSISNAESIKDHLTIQAEVAQHSWSETEKNLENSVKHGINELKESHATSLQIVGNKVDATRSDVKEVKEKQEKTQHTQVEILKAIQNLTLSVKYERPTNVLVPEETCTDATEHPVLWQMAIPEQWNLEGVEATLRNQSNKDEVFKKKFVRKGSLIMLTTISSRILSDPEAFEAAVISFLVKMIEDCEINTEIPDRLDVRLHILNANEVNVTCKLPKIPTDHKLVQTEGRKRDRNEADKSDLAFLNCDDKKESEWVENMSIMLETKYDITCAILAKDYLYGFPLKTKLAMHLKMFQAGLVTVTKNNYKHYSHIINESMPLVGVEIDYVGQIPEELWERPYINCTTCEHLWFPRLLDILRTSLPGKLKPTTESVKDETDCEKCKSSVATAVYHQFDAKRKGKFQTIICGSLTDEPWILDFIRKIMPFNQRVYYINRWLKQIRNPLENTSTIYVLISPNLLKCRSILEYIGSVDRKCRIVQLQITRGEIRSPLECFPLIKGYDTTVNNDKTLAHTIFPPDK